MKQYLLSEHMAIPNKKAVSKEFDTAFKQNSYNKAQNGSCSLSDY